MDESNALPPKPQEYFVLVEGQMHGPFTLDALKAALGTGDVTLEDFVQVGGLPIWRPLAQILNPPDPSEQLAKSESVPPVVPAPEETGEPSAPAFESPHLLPTDHSMPKWREIADSAKDRLRYDLEVRSVDIGLVLLGLGVVTCIAARWPFLFWLPWFGLAFLAGFGALKRGRTLQGVGLLVGACALPILFSMVLPVHRVRSPEPITDEPADTSESVTLASTPAPAPAPQPTAAQPDNTRPSTQPQPAVPMVIDSVRPAPGVSPAMPAPKKEPAVVPKAPATPVPLPPPSSSVSVETPQPVAAIPELKVPPLPQVPASKTADPVPGLPPLGLGDPVASTPIVGGDLVHKHRDSLVVVKDGSASGSGYICRDGQKTWLFTNVHVAAGMRNPKFNRLDGAQIRVGAAEAGGGRDVMRLAVADAVQPLDVLQNLDAAARIGDDVVVMGNSGGGGVVTALPGKLVGIGPDRIEVTAPFIPGNSGSPIVHVPTGKVIGIATYLTRRYEEFSEQNPRAAKPETAAARRFGYRLDGINQWEPVNWAAFHTEAEQLRQISALTEDVFDFLDALQRRVDPQFETEALRRPATEWLAGVRRPKVSPADRMRTTQNFLSSLRFMVHSDVAAAENRIRHSFFRERLQKEREVRDQLYKAFDDEVKKMTSPSLR